MASPTKVIKEIKDLGWKHISLSSVKGFDGAVQDYRANNGTVIGIGFSMNEAFILMDSQGFWSAKDIFTNIVKPADQDVTELHLIDGVEVHIIGNRIEGEVIDGEAHAELNDELVTRFGLDEAVQSDVINRLGVLGKMDVMQDIATF